MHRKERRNVRGLSSGDARFRIGPGGFVEHADISGVRIIQTARTFRGIVVDGFMPANPGERFPVRGDVVPVVLEIGVAGTPEATLVRASGEAGSLSVDVRIKVCPGRNHTLHVAADFAVRGAGWIAAMGLAMPLTLDPDPLRRQTTVGGERRNEVWRLDQNDEDDNEEWRRKVSDTRARWPLWRTGGLLVDAPRRYLIWKSSSRTTSPLPMDQGTQSPGWMKYATSSASVRVLWQDIHRHVPAGMTVDVEAGVLWVWLHPPAVRPLQCNEAITRSAEFQATIEGVREVNRRPKNERKSRQ